MSFLSRLWQSLRRPTHLVGRDLEGNRFFEYPGVSGDPRRTRRVVKYKHGHEISDFVSGSKRLPVQWTSWLTHTRHHPPTLEELHTDLERQRNILVRVAMIEARDREEAAQHHIAASQHAASQALVESPQVPDIPDVHLEEDTSSDTEVESRSNAERPSRAPDQSKNLSYADILGMGARLMLSCIVFTVRCSRLSCL
ncbi:Mimitin, mitochondrial [Grifola frondosa]|uniref:Mimitin, mitochondrial n=1 Tax=Grifola frondosa TaxID=5627 RepID=A0A1C7LSV0_GRIFR|nr:Mimitin, mitochondrial [Grifola frondosa]